MTLLSDGYDLLICATNSRSFEDILDRTKDMQMWHTPEGDRVLRGAEAKLIKAAITGVVELILEERGMFMDQWKYGVRLFDELEPSQRLATLDRVATYLLTDTPECLDLCASYEAAVGALFEHIRVELVWEADGVFGDSTRWEEVFTAAYQEYVADEPEDDDMPGLGDESWGKNVDLQLEMLADRILWDRDYEMFDQFMDAPPEKGELIKEIMGIDSEYFATAAIDAASDDGLDRIITHLASLIES